MESTRQLVDALRSGRRRPESYLDELEARFREREPSVQAFLPEEGRFQRLRSQAKALVDRYPDPSERPALFGLPVGVKDIFHADGYPTHAGSRLPPSVLEGREAEVVTRLVQAGALVMGKTVTTEFAYFAPGPTTNPHNPKHTPGGSSSGSAAAVAAGLCPLALGTQTIGSIIRPAAYCGVVGFKPTYDRISRAGVIPLAPSVDHVGVFTGDAAGATIAAQALVKDWKPGTSAETLARQPVLGVPEGPYLQSASGDGQHHLRNTCQRLMGKGYQVKFIQAMPDFDQIRARHQLIVAAEAARVHSEWYAEYGEEYHPKTTELIERGMKVSDSALSEALEGREKLRQELDMLMDQHGVDLWISPPAPGAAPQGLDSTGDPVMNLPWTHGGLPVVTLPSGYSETGLPLGLQVAGRWYADELLLAWAEGIESAVAPA